MADTRCLELRGRTWWCFKTLAPSLRAKAGKRQLRRSLETSDLAEALRRRPQALADFERQIDEIRRFGAIKVDAIANQALAWRRFSAKAIDENGQPLGDDIQADLLASQIGVVAQTYGPDAATRFETLVSTASFTPLNHYFDEFQRQNQKIIPKTRAEQKTALRRLMAWDDALSLEAFTRKVASGYVANGLGKSGTAIASQNKQITLLSSYWRWMLRKGYVETNPWTEQFQRSSANAGGGKKADEERACTDAELLALLNGPAPTRLADAIKIGALSGMRIDELCMLRVRDCADGWFDITKAKTKAGLRRVPIHSALKAMVAHRCKGKQPLDFLIHELGPEPATGAIRPRSDPLSKQFTKYRRAVGVNHVNKDADGNPTNRRSYVNYHSLRRWFCSKAEHAGVPEWTIASVVGHKREGLTLSRYSDKSSDEQARACVEAVRLPV